MSDLAPAGGRDVRVRFAPSPTGWLHVGGARTAYFNWLFARKHGGTFVLRIEDTDLARSTDASERGVIEDLRWLGLEADEGPGPGGGYGPYRQSERLAIYAQHARELIDKHAAYPCFCTDEELESRRAAALAAGRPPQYDGRCGKLEGAQSAARMAAGERASIRFRVRERAWQLHDLVRGDVTFPAGMVGDFVLLRSNGLPTYNFACVVDDHLMRISHVIRAEEHLANTPRQMMLYDAFGWSAPQFAHVALILNRDRTKMSKRAGEAAVAVGDWRRAGYVSNALLAYLALLGFHTGDDREVLTREELIAAFTPDRLGSSGSVFDAAKLKWMNEQHLHNATGAQVQEWLAAGPGELPGGAPAGADWQAEVARMLAPLAPEAAAKLLELVRGNVSTLAELPGELAALVSPPTQMEAEAQAALAAPGAAELLELLADALGALAEWSGEGFKSTLQHLGHHQGMKGKALFMPVRAALTGRTHGPELPLIAEILSREGCVARLRAAAKR